MTSRKNAALQYKIEVTPEFASMFDAIRDRRIRQNIVTNVEALVTNPEWQGKPLRDDLTGCRSKRSAGQRYRIIYSIDTETGIIWLLGVGLRQEGSAKKDIYSQMQKLAKGRRLMKHLKSGTSKTPRSTKKKE